MVLAVDAVVAVAGVVVLAVLLVVVALAQAKELARRKAWFDGALVALGKGFGPFGPRDDGSDGLASTGERDGRFARFAADKTTTTVRLEVALAPGVDKGAVFDLLVREGQGALETGTEGVLAGFDDEHDRIILRTRGGPDPAAVVRALLDEATAFAASLPGRLAKLAAQKEERARKAFGALTGADGRHVLLGIGFPLSPDAWERVRERPELVEWERVPPPEGVAPPCELRLYGVPQDPALADEGARHRLLERAAHAFVDRLPDGSFDGPAPEPKARSVAGVASHAAAECTVDYSREVVTREEESEPRPYRYAVRAVFAPWAVVVLDVAAPRDEACGILDALLGSASLAEPAPREGGPAAG